MRCDGNNEFTHRVDDGFVIARLVVSEPFAVVVFFELLEEFEEIRWEATKF